MMIFRQLQQIYRLGTQSGHNSHPFIYLKLLEKHEALLGMLGFTNELKPYLTV